jgi:hypothetical protein
VDASVSVSAFSCVRPCVKAVVAVVAVDEVVVVRGGGGDDG